MKVACTGAIAAVLAAGVACAGELEITVTHDLDAARPAEVIAVPFRELTALAPQLRMYHVVVRDPRGRVLPSQVTNYRHDHHGAEYDDLVFSYDFAPGEKRAVFTLQSSDAATPPEKPCAYARTVAERYDDMAWENDRIAHRMYAITLNTPAAGGERLRGSGIDVWGKRVDYPVVDRWYAKGHDQFHEDLEGEGLDLYSVGGSRGAGGTGLWDGAKLWTSDNFQHAEVLSNGPRRAAFRLSYAPWEAGTFGSLQETKQFTVDCGRNFDAVESVFDLPTDQAVIGIGITQHPHVSGFATPMVTVDAFGRWMSVWEENKDGGLGVAVVLDPGTEYAGFAVEPPARPPGNYNQLLLVKVRDSTPVRYYTGAGWNRSGQFSDRASWENYVRAFAAMIAHPLRITVGARP